MKTPRSTGVAAFILLGASLAGNLVLLFLVMFPRDPAAGPAPAGVSGLSRAPSSARASGTAAPGRPVDTLAWNSLASDDVRQFAASLESAGVDRELARLIVQARLAEDLAMRRNSLNPGATSTDYWRLPPADPEGMLARSRELRQLARDHARLVEELFGANPAEPSLQALRDQAVYGSLPPEKRDQLRQINEDYNDIGAAVTSAMRLAMLPDDLQQVRLLEAEREKDLRAVLSPEEAQEYFMRNSPIAAALRLNLEAFEPTEEEFRKLFALQQAFEDQYGTRFLSAAEAQAGAAQRTAARQQLDARIRETLGPERTADYERGLDPNYRMAMRAVSQLQLPRETGDRVYAMQKDIQTRATQARRNPDAAARTEALRELQQEAVRRATEVFGSPAAFEVYRTSGGTWIQGIVPPPAPPPK